MIVPEATAKFDPVRGIVSCHLKGLLTMEIVEDYERALIREVASARRLSPRVLILFENEAAIVQTAEIVARLRLVGQRTQQAGDRLAVVVGSALVKMQAERAMKAEPGERVFRSIEEAEAWLKS